MTFFYWLLLLVVPAFELDWSRAYHWWNLLRLNARRVTGNGQSAPHVEYIPGRRRLRRR